MTHIWCIYVRVANAAYIYCTYTCSTIVRCTERYSITSASAIVMVAARFTACDASYEYMSNTHTHTHTHTHRERERERERERARERERDFDRDLDAGRRLLEQRLQRLRGPICARM